MLRVGLDASAAAVHDPTGVAAAIRSLALALRALPATEGLALETLYRVSRIKRRSTFLPGSRLFHDRFSVLLARRLDVLHGPDARLPRLGGPRLVATLHDLSVRKDARFATDGFRATRERHWTDAARRADALVTYTEAVRREVSRELAFPPEKILAIPLAPATAAPLAPDEARAERARLGLEDRPYVLVLGELSARKNAAGAVRAFARASERSAAVRAARLVLVGRDGHGAAEVRAALEASRLGDRVSVPGWVPPRALWAVLAGARALLFPSRSEGFGLPLLEAMGASVPVLASRDPALVEVAGGAAVHEDADDEEALARGLERLLEDEGLRADLAARGRARAATFSWERTAREHARLYRALSRGEPLVARDAAVPARSVALGS